MLIKVHQSTVIRKMSPSCNQGLDELITTNEEHTQRRTVLSSNAWVYGNPAKRSSPMVIGTSAHHIYIYIYICSKCSFRNTNHIRIIILFAVNYSVSKDISCCSLRSKSPIFIYLVMRKFDNLTWCTFPAVLIYWPIDVFMNS